MGVLVIGAGLAGLAAAQRLTAAGEAVTVVEGRDRIGGRVYTKRNATGEMPAELGAEWLDGSSIVPDLVRAQGGTVRDSEGRFLLRTAAGLEPIEEGPDERLLRSLTSLAGDDWTLVEGLKRCCSGDAWRDARSSLVDYVEGFHAADPVELSVRWLQEVERTQSADASTARAVDGLDRAIEALRPASDSGCTLRLSAVVREVRWRRGRVSLVLRAGEDDADTEATLDGTAVVVTLPLSIMQAPPGHPSAVPFVPEVPGKRQALDRLSMGEVVKLVLDFDEPVWSGVQGADDMLFVQDRSQKIPTWWTTRPVESARLTGWAGGPQTRRLGDARGEALLDAALDSLAHALALQKATLRLSLRAWHHHEWRDDPFALGAYSWVRAGGVGAHRALAAPVEETLYFAGEATCGGGYNASARGAVESGRRAADELLADRARSRGRTGT